MFSKKALFWRVSAIQWYIESTKSIIENAEFEMENSKFLNKIKKKFHLFDFKTTLSLPKNFFSKQKSGRQVLKICILVQKQN